MGIHNEGGQGKYLGVPEQFGKKKIELFRYIVEKVKARTQGWSRKFLSPGGKEVLLKSIALAMPVYAMQTFKLPKQICKEINEALSKFWWRSRPENQGMHWFSWKRLSFPKKDGGLGFRDIESFNDAFLGKQIWRLIQNPNCLLSRVLRGRYFNGQDLLQVKAPRNSSFVWRSLLKGRDLVKKGTCFIVGKGSSINAWTNPWLQTNPARAPLAKSANPTPIMVDKLLTNTGQWDINKVRELIADEDIDHVLSIQLSPSSQTDFLGWQFTRSSLYSVKSGYHVAAQNGLLTQHPTPGPVDLKKRIWKIDTTPKMKHFIWRMITRSLALGENLERRHITQQNECGRCCQPRESTHHTFFECMYAKAVWRAAGIGLPSIHNTHSTVEDKMTQIMNFSMDERIDNAIRTLPLWILWRLWKSRNLLLYQNKDMTWEQTLIRAQRDTAEWNEMHQTHTDTSPMHQRTESRREQRNDQFWKRPPTCWIKCNYDTAFQHNQSSYTGCVIRDSNGTFKCAAQMKGKSLRSALKGELQALLTSLQFVWSMGHRQVIFEGDNKTVMDLINNKQDWFSVLNWIREIQHWRSKFTDVTFTWTPRKTNQVADILAKEGFREGISFCNHNNAHPSIVSQLNLDSMNAV